MTAKEVIKLTTKDDAEAALVAAHGDFEFVDDSGQRLSLKDAYHSNKGEDRSSVVEQALQQGLAAQLRDIPATVQMLKELYALAKQQRGSTQGLTTEDILGVLEVLFFASAGRAAYRHLLLYQSTNLSAKLARVFEVSSHQAVTAKLRKVSLSAVVSLMRVEPAAMSGATISCHRDQATDRPSYANHLLVKLWEALSSEQEMPQAQMRVLLETVDRVLASGIAPDLRIMVFTVASLLSPRRYYAVGESVVLQSLKEAQTAQWLADRLVGAELQTTDILDAALQDFPKLDIRDDSGDFLPQFDGKMHEFDAEEARDYSEHTSRHPNRKITDVDEIVENKLHAQKQVFEAIVTMPVTNGGTSDDTLKDKMAADFGAFLIKHFPKTEERHLAISALAVDIVEVLCQYYLHGLDLLETINTQYPAELTFSAKESLQEILDGLLTNKKACMNLLKGGREAIKELVVIPATTGCKNFKYKKSNGAKKATHEALKQAVSGTAQAGNASKGIEKASISAKGPRGGNENDQAQSTAAQGSSIHDWIGYAPGNPQHATMHRIATPDNGPPNPSTNGPENHEQQASRKGKRSLYTYEQGSAFEQIVPPHKRQQASGKLASPAVATNAQFALLTPLQSDEGVTEGDHIHHESTGHPAPHTSHAPAGPTPSDSDLGAEETAPHQDHGPTEPLLSGSNPANSSDVTHKSFSAFTNLANEPDHMDDYFSRIGAFKDENGIWWVQGPDGVPRDPFGMF
ncbi:hypothetical protein CBER1_10854 [Cercospora berteroae]|uniref:Uncharacterized protein n=1 Tax=Cercospora berteroae TaxID=357750 RepID=A0A2S6BYN4_9PEZI|nr:hypothetical protein CBER1_10854 [Cercospora berteroae]